MQKSIVSFETFHELALKHCELCNHNAVYRTIYDYRDSKDLIINIHKTNG